MSAHKYLNSLDTLNKQGQLGLRPNPLNVVPAKVGIDTRKHRLTDTLRIIVLFKSPGLWGFKIALEPQITLTLSTDSSIDCK